jgi:hypothetical protein
MVEVMLPQGRSEDGGQAWVRNRRLGHLWTGEPGLVLTHHPRQEIPGMTGRGRWTHEFWTVTHRPSGGAVPVGTITDENQGRAMLLAIAGVTDWNVPRSVVQEGFTYLQGGWRLRFDAAVLGARLTWLGLEAVRVGDLLLGAAEEDADLLEGIAAAKRRRRQLRRELDSALGDVWKLGSEAKRVGKAQKVAEDLLASLQSPSAGLEELS